MVNCLAFGVLFSIFALAMSFKAPIDSSKMVNWALGSLVQNGKLAKWVTWNEGFRFLGFVVLLHVQVAVLPHLNTLGHVPHCGILCNVTNVVKSVVKASW